MKELRQHNVIGWFEDLEGARRAVTRLERRGIDEGDVSLLAPRFVEEGEAGPDGRAAGEVGRRVAKGAVAGSAAGGLAGLGAGLAFTIPGVGPVVGSGVLGAALSGAVGGGGMGGLLAGISGLGMGSEWERTFERLRDGRVCLVVHSEDRSVVERGERVLREAGADQVTRLGRPGG